MNTKKHIFALLSAILLLGSVLQGAITFVPLKPVPGQTVTFTLNPTHPNLEMEPQITWNWADGSTEKKPISQLTATHAYDNPGNYEVSARYYYRDTAGAGHYFTETTLVRVTIASKTITFQPAQPNSCEPVTFQAAGFVSPQLRWDFGDGTVQSGGGMVMVHAYSNPGSFMVRAFDNNGSDVNPATAIIIVNNKRTLSLLTTQPKTGLPVSFQASGFISACLLWDFGDGQPRVKGTAAASHVFANPGQFQVTALDNCGESLCKTSISVPVIASQGPLAPFTISYGILRFENGTTNISIGKNTLGLTALADLKFEGSGLLQVEWRVDGKPFKTTAQSLGFAGQITIDSGKMPGLPTTVQGTHTVSLVIVKPEIGFTIPDISYYVTAIPEPVIIPPFENLQAPIIQTIIPGSLEQGKEYVLDLQGMRLTPDTVISLGTGIAILSNGYTFIDPTRASLAIFVSPTAKLGDRYAKASNGNGANTGPGKVKIAKSPPQPPIEPVVNLLCTDLSTMIRDEIELKEPRWFKQENILGFEDTGNAGAIPAGQTPPEVVMHTVDDLDVLRWKTLGPVYDYIEVRFYKAKTNQLLLTKRIEGAATSMPITGGFLMELGDSFFADTSLLVNTGAYAAGSSAFHAPADQTLLFGESSLEQEKEQQMKKLFQEALKKADIAWQVASFQVFPCVYDSKKNTANQFNQTIEIGLSDVGLFKMPDRPNGVTCPATGMKTASAPVKVQNSTKTARDMAVNEANSQASADFQGSTSESNTDYVGDKFDLAGTLVLSRSPYGSHPVSGTTPVIPNLFIDWGDGTGAKPLGVEIADKEKNWEKSVLLRIKSGTPNTSHIYQKAGSDFVIRIFELSENDIQKPAANFLAKLSKALAPSESQSSSDSSPYYLLVGDQGGKLIDESAEAFSVMLGRAYMLFCQPVTIHPYHDTCVDQPLKLLGIEITSFPGHNIYKPKDPQSDDGIKLYSVDLAKYLMAGINAVAVTCDEGLHAKAELTYVGTGSIELLWQVDNHVVEKRLFEQQLTSSPRPNLSEAQAQDCSQALSTRVTFDSSQGVLPVGPGNEYLGMHKVNVLARVVADPALSNLYQYAADSAFNLFASREKNQAEASPGQSGPSSTLLSPAVQETHVFDPLLAAMQQAQAHGQSVPQIGFLNPNPEAEGPAVAYLNDSLDKSHWPAEDSTDWVQSAAKHYQVNEVRNLLGCQVRIPDGAGNEYFRVTDMGDLIVLNDNGTYSATNGILHLPYLTGTGSYGNKFVPIKFDQWSINSETGVVTNGILDVSTSGVSDFKFPSFIKTSSKLTHLQGGVNNNNPIPMMATFDFDLASKLLSRIQNGAEHSASILGAKGRLTAGGDWIAVGQTLAKTEIGLTSFHIQSDAVTVDLSTKENPAQYQAQGPGWTGVYFGQAMITPYTLGFIADPSSGFAMNTTQDWVLQAGHLNGRAKSTQFLSIVDLGFFKFGSVDFGVTNDVPDGTYHNLSVKAPWLDTALSGNAVLQVQSNGHNYNTILTLNSHAPVLLTYSDPAKFGQVTMTASDFSFKTATLGANLPAVECQVVFDLRCEDIPFAQFAVNDFDFLFDGRALFNQQYYSRILSLSGSTQFGQSDATLKQVVVTAPSQGAGRLGIAVDIDLGYAKDSEQAQYVPTTPATVRYQIAAQGKNYVAQGPESQSIPITLKFPLGNPDLESECQPEYNPQLGNSSSGEAGGAGPSAGDDSLSGSLSGTRFSAKIPLSVFGVDTGAQATFILGYNDQGSYFLTAADVPLASGLPLSPIPLSIFGFKGGFGYHFNADTLSTANVNAQPNMSISAAFAAGVKLGTSDKFTLMAEAVLAGDSSGHFLMRFSDAKLLDQGNFGGKLDYCNKVFSGCVFGQLKMLDSFPVVDFDLGETEGTAKVNFHFGGGSWHVNAGSVDNPITADILGYSTNGYLMLSPAGLKTGGGIHVVVPPGVEDWPITAYVYGNLNVGLSITPVPHFSGSFAAEVGWVARLSKLLEGNGSVTAGVMIEATDPTSFCIKASFFGLDFYKCLF